MSDSTKIKEVGEELAASWGGAFEAIDKAIDEFPDVIRESMYSAMIKCYADEFVKLLREHNMAENEVEMLGVGGVVYSTLKAREWPEQIAELVLDIWMGAVAEYWYKEDEE